MKEHGSENSFILGPWPTALAWVACVLVSAGTLRNAYRHLSCYSRPDLQQHVLRIIMVGPLYALSAALCLSMGDAGCFFVRSVRDIWEAVVIYSFLTLIIEYMGGEHLCLHSISQRDEAVPHLFPLNFCLKPIPTGSMIRYPKIGALQFVAVKPVVAAISIVVYACGQYEDWYYQWSLFIVYNISYSVALYALYLIYWASHEHPSLQAKRPLLKFVSVKMIVFLTFWQALLLPHTPLPGDPRRWEDFILSCEMVIFGLLMNAAFSWQEFQTGVRSSSSTPSTSKSSKSATGPSFLKHDKDLFGSEEPPPSNAKPTAQGEPGVGGTGDPAPISVGHSQVVQNAKAAFCPRDIISDASANFSRRYQRHVLIESAQDYELDVEHPRSETPAGASASASSSTAPPAASSSSSAAVGGASASASGGARGGGGGAAGADAAADPEIGLGGPAFIVVDDSLMSGSSNEPPPASSSLGRALAPSAAKAPSFGSAGGLAAGAQEAGRSCVPKAGADAVPALHRGFLPEGAADTASFQWPASGEPPAAGGAASVPPAFG